jgi:hypothetical protein
MNIMGSMAIEAAWAIINADLAELTPGQRAVRRNLARRFRERRRPFTKKAMQAFSLPALRALIEGTSTNLE